MKLFTPEISWHQKEPIFSVNFLPATRKLATCGADFTIKIWLVKEDGEGNVGLDFLSNLDRHTKPVNVVRFSPDGKLLASAGDDGTIILWKLNENGGTDTTFGSDEPENKESWNVFKMLRGHIEDIYDLAWSPDSQKLISGSVDNSAIVWDAIKGKNLRILTDHKHYVQGVCWDPRDFYVATHSSDRSCRLYNSTTYKCTQNIHKNQTSYMKEGKLTKSKYGRMFMDETMQSFFRRSTFSPDGSFLILPAGLCDGETKPEKCTYVFARGHFKKPICRLPGPKQATIAVKCSPIVYELMEDKENCLSQKNEFFKVPYRMVFAVASLDAITFYDTQHQYPIGMVANMHYASLTDITWSSDGRLLVASSMDGYCSFVNFEEGELGTPISFDPIEYQVTQAQIRKASKKEKKKSVKTAAATADAEAKEEEKKKLLQQAEEEKEKQAAAKRNQQPTIEKMFVTPVRKRKRPLSMSPNNSQGASVGPSPSAGASPVHIQSPVISSTNANKTPKRANLTTLSTGGVATPPNLSASASGMISPPPHPAPQSSLAVGVKTPKRVQVLTLSEPSTVQSPPAVVKPPPSTSVKKPPKRVEVTTLLSTPPSTAPTNVAVSLQSPAKPAPTAIAVGAVTPKAPKRAHVITISQSPAKPVPSLTCREFASPTRERDVIIPLSPHKVKPVKKPGVAAAETKKPRATEPVNHATANVYQNQTSASAAIVSRSDKLESLTLEEARERVFGDAASESPNVVPPTAKADKPPRVNLLTMWKKKSGGGSSGGSGCGTLDTKEGKDIIVLD